METVAALLGLADRWVGYLLIPVGVWIVVSAADDLVIMAVWLLRRPRVQPPPAGQPERPIAIFVPCWREAAVIGRMIEHNFSAIRYRNYHWFVGAYPNDPDTQQAVERVIAKHPNVHLALCPQEGPTSKADCLNWVFQCMLLFEQESGARFEVVLQHDAEDLVHPQSLEWVNFYSRFFGMIQTPVLALPTPVRQLTHGLYCDDFAYSHQIELPVRYLLGGFVPSAGVGTAYRRDALEQLAAAESNRVFAPECLTEDYENGYRLHRLGIKQLFIPPYILEGKPLATREYFPKRFHAALRQRTRWVTGIVFQGWQRHGWGRGWDRYWFWRDRKGLVGAPLSAATNALFAYGVGSGSLHALLDIEAAAPPFAPLLMIAGGIGLLQMAARVYSSMRVYGWRFALGVPLRSVPGNVLNCLATAGAAKRFFAAKARREPLVWLKTEHAYPSVTALQQHKRPLADILLAAGFATQEAIAGAERTMPPGVGLGEYLVEKGMLSSEDLCEALSMLHNLPAAWLDPAMLRMAVARSLPAQIVRAHQVLPVAVKEGVLRLATPAVPSDRLQQELRALTRLETEFILVPADNFQRLCEHVLGEGSGEGAPAEAAKTAGVS